MLRFSEFLAESFGVDKLKHLTHVEDHVLNAGKVGFDHAKKTLDAIHAKLSGEESDAKITTKHDGSPSIVFGVNPENGKFFVATKSAFNKKPKVNYTPDDIEKNHGANKILVGKLKTALEHLPKIAPKRGVYQADMMFTKGDIKKEGNLVHFTANTVTHSIDKNSDEAGKMKKAHMGLVIHTRYDGQTLADMKPSFDVEHSVMKKHPDVFQIIPDMEDFHGEYGDTQKKMFKLHMKKANEHHGALKDNDELGYHAINGHDAQLKQYVNHSIKKSAKTSTQGYIQFLADKAEEDTNAARMQKTKDAKKKHHEGIIKHVELNKIHFDNIFGVHNNLSKAKKQLELAMSTHQPNMNYSIDGKLSKPEGYVVVLKGKDGSPLPSKIVDRQEFSKKNFDKHSKDKK